MTLNSSTLHVLALGIAGSAFFLDSPGLLCYSILMFHTTNGIGSLLEALP
jgi:hypothetical protein